MTKAEIWEIAPAWVKAWEKFAGRPYNKAENARKPGTIKAAKGGHPTTVGDIVRLGQDMLCGMHENEANHQIRDHIRHYMACHQPSYTMTNEETGAIYYTPFSSELAGPPQSLGELCIEIAQDYIMFDQGFVPGADCWLNARPGRYVGTLNGPGKLSEIRGDIQQLKQAMWHKHTDPEEEEAIKWWEETSKLEVDNNGWPVYLGPWCR